jgi:hypothetical protein
MFFLWSSLIYSACILRESILWTRPVFKVLLLTKRRKDFPYGGRFHSVVEETGMYSVTLK